MNDNFYFGRGINKDLGPFCRLVNPLLQGGDIRVNAKYLLENFGREFHPDEKFLSHFNIPKSKPENFWFRLRYAKVGIDYSHMSLCTTQFLT